MAYNAKLPVSLENHSQEVYNRFNENTAIEKAALIFNKKMDKCKDDNNGFPKEKDIIIVNGTKMDQGTIFADLIAVQNNKIYTKLSEIKNL